MHSKTNEQRQLYSFTFPNNPSEADRSHVLEYVKKSKNSSQSPFHL